VNVSRWQPFSINEELAKSESNIAEDVATTLDVGKHGRLSTLKWISGSVKKLSEDEVEIETRAVGMNFKVRSNRPHEWRTSIIPVLLG
jgi:hypothetical protein